jgi:hypothetical protein
VTAEWRDEMRGVQTDALACAVRHFLAYTNRVISGVLFELARKQKSISSDLPDWRTPRFSSVSFWGASRRKERSCPV